MSFLRTSNGHLLAVSYWWKGFFCCCFCFNLHQTLCSKQLWKCTYVAVILCF